VRISNLDIEAQLREVFHHSTKLKTQEKVKKHLVYKIFISSLMLALNTI
jgi:hypothetical protein